jgi:ABC-type uncharacterized transport system auxiliary subunit
MKPVGLSKRVATTVATFAALAITIAGCSPSGTVEGTWSLDLDASSDIDQWRALTMTVRLEPDTVWVKREFNAGRYNRSDSTVYSTDDSEIAVPREASAKWLDNVHLGVFLDKGTVETVSGRWRNPNRQFETSSSLPLKTSTGVATVVTHSLYDLARDGNTLTVTHTRKSRDPSSSSFAALPNPEERNVGFLSNTLPLAAWHWCRPGTTIHHEAVKRLDHQRRPARPRASREPARHS